MMAPTHMAMGALAAAIPQAGMTAILASAVGALLPDIDHPQSSIGRVFFFISAPLNSLLGHRTWTHSFVVWGPIAILGAFFDITVLTWLAIGACTHIVGDTLTTSGVQAFLPMTDRTVVCFRRDWRFNTGSLKEIFILILCIILIGLTHQTYALGGPRKMINYLINSHRITAEEYLRAGERIAWAEGNFRWADGRIQAVDWLVVGTEGLNLVFWDGETLIKQKHGGFLRSKLVESEHQWPSVRLEGVAYAKSPTFYFGGKKWLYAMPGDPIYGTIKCVSGEIPTLVIRSSIEEKILGKEIDF